MAVRPAASASALAPGQLLGQLRSPARRAAARGRRGRRGPRRRPATPRPGSVGEVLGRRGVLFRSVAGAGGDGSGDGVLGGVFQGAGQAQELSSSSVPAVAWTAWRVIRPVVTVPVLSRTIVSTRRVVSRTSGPLIRMPSWAPRPVPTMRAVGVARPRAQGQAMISTATAAVKAAVTSDREAQPDAQGDQRDERGRPARTPRRSGRRAAGPPPCRSARPRRAWPSGPAGCRRRSGWPRRRAGRPR